MCGITGIVSAIYSQDQMEFTLSEMARTMTHRGPDDDGVWVDARTGVGLAHRRLSIIDLSAEGRQPMVSPSGRYVITYNGEIYNFKSIRKELETERLEWRGGSDTETILAAIETWGLEVALDKFIGMFAFALWDRKDRTIYLCRDRLGIKPLYYSYDNKSLIFGSELKPILACPGFKPEINREALTLYFRHNCVPAPYSIFRNTWKLMPGSILAISVETILSGSPLPSPRQYWSAEQAAARGLADGYVPGINAATEELELLLRDSVKLRMISDVSLGAFLSGGIDSSTIVALMQDQSSRRVRTFSIGFEEDGYNEAGYAKAVAEHIGTDHTELYVSARDALSVIPELPRLFDEPFSDSSQIPTVILSKLTREHVTVSLSGDGGDELFGGYNRHFWGRRIIRAMEPIPLAGRKLAGSCLQAVPPLKWDSVLLKLMRALPTRYRMDMPGDRIHKFADVISSNSPESIYRLLVSHWRDPETLVVNAKEPVTALTRDGVGKGIPDFTSRMMLLDLLTYLPDDILTKVDRASMGASLEARVPILDHRVVEFAWRLPLSMKINGNIGKWILRRVLYKYVPKELIERPKTGFGISIDAWLRGPLRDWAEALLNSKSIEEDGILDPVPIRKKWLEHLSGRLNWQYDLWDVLMFLEWKRVYLR